jgi:hypothetical protein
MTELAHLSSSQKPRLAARHLLDYVGFVSGLDHTATDTHDRIKRRQHADAYHAALLAEAPAFQQVWKHSAPTGSIVVATLIINDLHCSGVTADAKQPYDH